MALSVLVVDDHASLRRLLETVLVEDVRFDRVLTADGETAALAVADCERPDCVVLDADLRGVDGLQLVRPLKELLPQTAVVVFSSAPYATARKAKTAGADAFVEKGTDLDALLDVLAAEHLRLNPVVDLRDPEGVTPEA